MKRAWWFAQKCSAPSVSREISFQTAVTSHVALCVWYSTLIFESSRDQMDSDIGSNEDLGSSASVNHVIGKQCDILGLRSKLGCTRSDVHAAASHCPQAFTDVILERIVRLRHSNSKLCNATDDVAQAFVRCTQYISTRSFRLPSLQAPGRRHRTVQLLCIPSAVLPAAGCISSSSSISFIKANCVAAFN